MEAARRMRGRGGQVEVYDPRVCEGWVGRYSITLVGIMCDLLMP